MTRRGEDRAQGFAKQSVEKSPAPPSRSSPDHQEQGDRTAGHHPLTRENRPADSNERDPDRPARQDRYKP